MKLAPPEMLFFTTWNALGYKFLQIDYKCRRKGHENVRKAPWVFGGLTSQTSNTQQIVNFQVLYLENGGNSLNIL